MESDATPPLTNEIPQDLRRSSYAYDLPRERIAQEPLTPRDSAKLMVLARDGELIEHAIVRDLPRLLRAGDLLVFNDTRVLPARLWATRETGGRVEVFLLSVNFVAQTAEALTRSRARLQAGEVLWIDTPEGPRGIRLTSAPGQDGKRAIEFPDAWLTPERLDAIGQMPLPPYITREHDDERLATLDRERYQTVFAREPGAVAAPTAGLHFTPELLQALDAAGIQRAFVTLHVGLGTFLPLRTEDVREHVMHSETYTVPAETQALLDTARRESRRIIAVGTTVARVLETLARGGPATGSTDIFIHPHAPPTGFDGLFTNYHLPESTLIMLVAGLIGRERTLARYADALAADYRFYSYGDAMLIQPAR